MTTQELRVATKIIIMVDGPTLKCGPLVMSLITTQPPFACNRASKYVAYYRVSTQRQGNSGLGLEAQQFAINEYLQQSGGELLSEFVEVESGRKVNRPKLDTAMKMAKKAGATLLIAKLDRLARNVHFITGLMAANVDFVACDMPSANKLTIGILACVAEDEADRISHRTKAALKAAKARGVKLGVTGKVLAKKYKAEANARAKELIGVINEIRSEGVTAYHKIAKELNHRGVKTAKNAQWHGTSVMRVVKRVENGEVLTA